MQIDNWNRRAVRTLLADAGRPLALPEVENVRGNLENVPDTIANARKTYLDFVRRSGPLIMSDDDQVAFQKALDRLTAFLNSSDEPLQSNLRGMLDITPKRFGGARSFS